MRKFESNGPERSSGTDRNAKRQRLCEGAEGVARERVHHGAVSDLNDGCCSARRGLPAPVGVDSDSDSEPEELPCDTLAALLVLKSEFGLTKEVERVVRPVALKSQLYSIVNDKTIVDRELDSLRHAGKIRCFKLRFAADEYAVMLAEDYEGELRECAAGRAALCRGDVRLLSEFAEKVLPRVADVSVSHDDLVACLSGNDVKNFPKDSKPKKDVEVESGVSTLLNEGFLTRTSDGRPVYYFNSPSVGKVVASVVKGRKEIVGLLNRKRRYPEMFEKDLLTKCKLKQSTLGVKFHLRDLVGKGVLVEMKTTRGLVLRVANKTD